MSNTLECRPMKMCLWYTILIGNDHRPVGTLLNCATWSVYMKPKMITKLQAYAPGLIKLWDSRKWRTIQKSWYPSRLWGCPTVWGYNWILNEYDFLNSTCVDAPE